MTLLVDTSVWSLALRRDAPPVLQPEVQALTGALAGSALIVITGLVLQELLQGFAGAKSAAAITARFSGLAWVQPTREDHIGAAELRNHCRRAGVQVGTVDALIAQLCIRHELTLLTTDQDFTHVARHSQLKVWAAAARGLRR